MAAVVLVAALAACHIVPPYSVDSRPFATASAPVEQRAEEIKHAAAETGWVAQEQGPGAIRATYSFKDIKVIVNITFTPETFSIHYDPATTNYDGTNVNKHDNTWMKKLEAAIRRESQT